MCRGFGETSKLRRAMERPAPLAGQSAAVLCCECTTEGHVLKAAKKLWMIGIACACVVVAGSIHSDVLHDVEATKSVKFEQRPSFGNHPIGNRFSDYAQSSTGKTTVQQNSTVQDRPPAEHRKLAALGRKQVGGTETWVVLPQDEQEPEGSSTEFGRRHEKTDGNSDVGAVLQAKRTGVSLGHSSIADGNPVHADTEQSYTAAEFPEDTEVKGRSFSPDEDQLKTSKAADMVRPTVTGSYGEVHPSDLTESVLEDFFPADSPLSGPLEEIYMPGYTEAYDANTHSDGKGSLSVFLGKTDTGETQNEPPRATDEAERDPHDAGHNGPGNSVLESQLQDTQQLHWSSVDGVLEASAVASDPISPPPQMAKTGHHSRQSSTHTDGNNATSEPGSQGEDEWTATEDSDITTSYHRLMQEKERPQSPVAEKTLPGSTLQYRGEEGASPTAETVYLRSSLPTEHHGTRELPPAITEINSPALSSLPDEDAARGLSTLSTSDGISASEVPLATALPTEMAPSTPAYLSVGPSGNVDEVSAVATGNYSLDNHVTQHVTPQQTSREPLSGNLRKAAEQDSELRSLPLTQEQEQQLRSRVQQAAASLPALDFPGSTDVKQDSVDIWTAEDSWDVEGSVPPGDLLSQDDSTIFPESVVTDHLVQKRRSDEKPAAVIGDFAEAPEKRMMRFTASASQQGNTGRTGEEGGGDTGYYSQPEIAGQGHLPIFGENVAVSSPPRRAEPAVQEPTAREAPGMTESNLEESIVREETSHDQETPLEEGEATAREETNIETTGSPPDIPLASEEATEESALERPPEASTDAAVIADPREGACSTEELTALTEYFANQSESCAAYRCIDEAGAEFLEKLQEHYGAVYEPSQQEELAGLFAACYCRCPMMKCEVDYVMDRGSPSCKAATVDYCEASNEKFVQRCTSAAQQLPLLYDLNLDTAGFKVPCRVCRQEDVDADAAGFGPVLDGTEEEESPLESEGTPAAPGGSSSSTNILNDAREEYTETAASLLEQNSQSSQEEDYGIEAEKEKDDSDLNLEDEEEYDEDLPFLQVDEHVSTTPPTNSSAAIQHPPAEEMEGVSVPGSEEQGLSTHRESHNQGGNQEPPYPSTHTAPPLEDTADTESTVHDQRQPPPTAGDDQEEEATEASNDGVIIQSSAIPQALLSAVVAISVVTPLFTAPLAI